MRRWLPFRDEFLREIARHDGLSGRSTLPACSCSTSQSKAAIPSGTQRPPSTAAASPASDSAAAIPSTPSTPTPAASSSPPSTPSSPATFEAPSHHPQDLPVPDEHIARYRCRDCHSHTLYCAESIIAHHKRDLPLHRLEVSSLSCSLAVLALMLSYLSVGPIPISSASP